MSVDPRLMLQLRNAFLDHGFEGVSMTELAEACGFSRRALYHHYSNKEEVYRDHIRFHTGEALRAGCAAAEKAFARGQSAVDVITTLLDIRFGNDRRTVSGSAHAQELADAVFRLCGDIIIDVQVHLHDEIVRLLEALQARGKLKLKPDVTVDELARMLAEGSRGVNQARPPLREHEFAARYRAISAAILFGCATVPSAE